MQITIRPLKETDLPNASHIIRVAFGTLFGDADLERFWLDIDVARTRWLADPASAFGADVEVSLSVRALPLDGVVWDYWVHCRFTPISGIRASAST